jgi:hypothetical protein
MKDYKKIVRYLDGQMSVVERKSFESELQTSEILKKKFKEIKFSIDTTKELSNVEVQPEYFNDLYARFHLRNQEAPKINYKLRLSVAFASFIVVAFTFIFYFYITKNTSEENIVYAGKQLTSEDINDIAAINLNLYNMKNIQETVNLDESDIQAINDKIYNELELKDHNMVNKVYLNPSGDLSDMMANLSEKEIDNIYNELSNKKIL